MRGRLKIKQLDSYDCGAACLLSVGVWWGITVPLSKIRRECGCTPEGISVGGIIEGAKSIGLDAKGFKSDSDQVEEKVKNLQELKKIHSPIIAHTTQEDNMMHFVVIYKIKSGKIYLMDPAVGEEVIEDIEIFAKKWTGIIVTFHPNSNFQTIESENRKWKLIKHSILLYNREIVKALGGSVLLALLGFCNSLMLQIIIDKIIPSGNPLLLIGFSSLLMLLLPVSLFIGYARNIFLLEAEIKIDTDLILGFLKKIFSLDILSLSGYSTGDLEKRMSDTAKIREFATNGIIRIIVSGMTFIMVIVLMFVFYSKLAIYTILMIPFYLIIYLLANKRIKKLNREVVRAGAAFEGDVIDTIEGIESVKHFFSSKSDILYSDNYCNLAEKRFKNTKRVLWFSFINTGLSQLLLVIIIIVSSVAIIKGNMSVGEMVAFYTLSSFFIIPMNELIEFNAIKNEALVASERVQDIMNIESEECGEFLELEIAPADLKVENLCFKYKGKEELLNNINCSFKSGYINLLRGSNGCGKSTLGKLLLRDLSAIKGKIVLNGNNIESYNIESWRKYIGIAPQTVHLFNSTILNNITSFDSGYDSKRVAEICILTGLDQTISTMPNGLLTFVGSKGNWLSGGECQKIAIARLLYLNPSIYIFDEATSFMDFKSEGRIIDLLQLIKSWGKTIIVISHSERFKNIADNLIEI